MCQPPRIPHHGGEAVEGGAEDIEDKIEAVVTLPEGKDHGKHGVNLASLIASSLGEDNLVVN